MSLYRAARGYEPLNEELGPVRGLIFEIMQGPANAPMAWGVMVATVCALLFVFVVRVSIPSSIVVTSDPPSAEVFVDGVRLGVAPLKIRELTRGPHNVELRASGYESAVVRAEIEPFAKRRFAVALNVAKARPAMPEVAAVESSVMKELFGNRTGSPASPAKRLGSSSAQRR